MSGCHKECCKHLSASGPVQTLDEMDWERGLWGAAHEGDLNRIKILLEKGKCVNSRDNSGYIPLHYAARNGHFKVCEILINSGAEVNAVTKGGATPLHRAAYTGKEEVVQLLLNCQAKCLLQDADGRTALHKAAEGQQQSVCKLLIEHNPDLCNIKDKKGQLPFHYALSSSLTTILKTSCS